MLRLPILRGLRNFRALRSISLEVMLTRLTVYYLPKLNNLDTVGKPVRARCGTLLCYQEPEHV